MTQMVRFAAVAFWRIVPASAAISAGDGHCRIWRRRHKPQTSTQMVIRVLAIAKAQEMVKKIIDKHRRALAEAILTPPQAQTAAHKELLAILLA